MHTDSATCDELTISMTGAGCALSTQFNVVTICYKNCLTFNQPVYQPLGEKQELQAKILSSQVVS